MTFGDLTGFVAPRTLVAADDMLAPLCGFAGYVYCFVFGVLPPLAGA